LAGKRCFFAEKKYFGGNNILAGKTFWWEKHFGGKIILEGFH
jgi:hypothetical protein